MISQRRDLFGDHGELRDSLDARWYDLLPRLFGAEISLFPVPNVPEQLPSLIKTVNPDVVVLTGGNDISSQKNSTFPVTQRDRVETALMKHAAHNCLPVLGVCRGFQFMNVFLGGSIIPIQNHVGCSHRVNTDTKDLFVNSYHNFGVSLSGLAETLIPLARDDEGNVEAAYHSLYPWIGVMWHPERTSADWETEKWLLKLIKRHGVLARINEK